MAYRDLAREIWVTARRFKLTWVAAYALMENQLMDTDIPPDYQDLAREYPAARCRECDAITHVCTANDTFEEYTCSTCQKKRRACPHTARLARTRDTGMHLDDGWKLVTSNHRKGCSKPASRLALLMMLRDQAPELEGSDLEARLERYMTEKEVRTAANELLRHLHDR